MKSYRWEMTAEEASEHRIQRMVKVGTELSRYCRNPFTGERTRPCVEMRQLTDWHMLIHIAGLIGYRPLIDIADIADLRGIVYLGRADQHNWNAARWEKEIRARIS